MEREAITTEVFMTFEYFVLLVLADVLSRVLARELLKPRR